MKNLSDGNTQLAFRADEARSGAASSVVPTPLTSATIEVRQTVIVRNGARTDHFLPNGSRFTVTQYGHGKDTRNFIIGG